MSESYDRAAESLGNILHMEHVNLMIPEQASAILFYITGLRCTRDPFLMTGLDNMWVNIGRSQIHLPRRDPSPQVLRGIIGLVTPDLKEIETAIIKPTLKALNQKGVDYRGVLYVGLMLTSSGPKVIEYNVRMNRKMTKFL